MRNVEGGIRNAAFDRLRRVKGGKVNAEFGMRNVEGGKVNAECGNRNQELGMRKSACGFLNTVILIKAIFEAWLVLPEERMLSISGCVHGLFCQR